MTIHNTPTTRRPSAGQRAWQIGRLLVRAVADLMDDNAFQGAAAIAYYSLLSTFPLLLAGVSLTAFFVDERWAIEQAIRLFGEFVPTGTDEIAAIVEEAVAARGTAGLLSFGALLWTGSRVFGAITHALNLVYGVPETYGLVKRTLIEIGMLLTLGVLFIVALIAPVVLDLLTRVLRVLPFGGGVVAQLIGAIVSPALVLLTFFLVYRFVPRGPKNHRAAFAGAVVATLLFVIARPIFLYYIEQFADYNVVYGSLAIIVILIFWAWIVALILLYGGEVAAQMQALPGEQPHPDPPPLPAPPGLAARGAAPRRVSALGVLAMLALLGGGTLLRWLQRRS
jgi:membrane protein